MGYLLEGDALGLEVLSQDDVGAHVADLIAIVGGREDGDELAVVLDEIALVLDLVGANDEI